MECPSDCSREWCERLRLLFVLAILRVSIASGQSKPIRDSKIRDTIFRFGSNAFPSTEYTAQFELYNEGLAVPGSPDAKIQVLDGVDNFTFDGDFSPYFPTEPARQYGLNLTTAPSNEPPQNVSNPVTFTGQCFYNSPVRLRGQLCANANSVTAFSTMFVISLFGTSFQRYESPRHELSDTIQQVAFVLTNDTTRRVDEGGYLGWIESFNRTASSVANAHYFAVELYFQKINGTSRAIGVNLDLNTNGARMRFLNPAGPLLLYLFGYEADLQVWIEYNALNQILEVFVSADWTKSIQPWLSIELQLDTVFQDTMFVGFSGIVFNHTSSDSPPGWTLGYKIIEWTFNSNGLAPDYPRDRDGSLIDTKAEALSKAKQRRNLILGITVPASLIFVCLAAAIFTLQKRISRLNALAKKYQLEELEQLGRGPQSFKYKSLSAATGGFSSSALLGTGGFGSVYRGNLSLKGLKNRTEIAVKRISTTSHQGAREFLAEIKVIGQVQHRNLVQLLGWCHERGELLLVYDFMPNGSLDQHLYCEDDSNALSWSRRLKILSGVATALAYLHEEWEKRVIHRDVKSSNVMLDSNFNARLGDFGLAKLSDHDQAPPSTLVLAGTRGYLAPELGHTLRATEQTDVYSFGALVLEVATGKRPILSRDQEAMYGELLLVDWIWRLHGDGRLLEAADSRLETSWDSKELVTLLKIGLLCSHPDPDERPSMREVLSIWTGSSPFPFLPETKPVPTFASRITISDSTLVTEMSNCSDSAPMMSRSTDDGSESNEHQGSLERRGSFQLLRVRSDLSNPGLRSRAFRSTPLPL